MKYILFLKLEISQYIALLTVSQCIAIYHIATLYRDAYRIARFLPILSPNSLQTYLNIAWDRQHILEWAFIVASLRHTCAIIMLSNQHLDMPHL